MWRVAAHLTKAYVVKRAWACSKAFIGGQVRYGNRGARDQACGRRACGCGREASQQGEHGGAVVPPHAGRIVRRDCIEPLGLTVTEGAKALGVSRNALSALINEWRGISPEMAIRLDKAFGGGADTWHRMQAAYGMAQVMRNADKVKVDRVVRAVPPAALLRPQDP